MGLPFSTKVTLMSVCPLKRKDLARHHRAGHRGTVARSTAYVRYGAHALSDDLACSLSHRLSRAFAHEQFLCGSNAHRRRRRGSDGDRSSSYPAASIRLQRDHTVDDGNRHRGATPHLEERLMVPPIHGYAHGRGSPPRDGVSLLPDLSIEVIQAHASSAGLREQLNLGIQAPEGGQTITGRRGGRMLPPRCASNRS